MSEAQQLALSAGIKRLFPGHAVYPVGHIGDEAGDLGHGIGLLERPVKDFHDFLIIPCGPVIAEPLLLIRLLLFDVNAKVKAILGEKEVTIKENDHVTSRNA